MNCNILLITPVKSLYSRNSLTENMKRKRSATKFEPVKKGHSSLGLLASMEDPDMKVKEDDKTVVIKDKYPKARFHYLVLSKQDISGIRNVTKEHTSLLKHMEKIGMEITKMHPDYEFIIGYHAIPSMYRLHLHVISTDFDSPRLKTKYHWNSFTTPFFRPSEDVRKQLEELGKIQHISESESDKYLHQSLKCHKCSTFPKNMPELKKHILQHITVKNNLAANLSN